MRIWILCCAAALAVGPLPGADAQNTGAPSAATKSLPASPNHATGVAGKTPTAAPISDEDKANQLSEQVDKLMVKCVNLLTAQDPLSLDYCKQQRDLADQYPPKLRMTDKMLAHDEYGIALAAFDHKQEALEEFDREILLLPKAVKPGTTEWSTAYWHRAMIHSELGDSARADHDYREAEDSLRKQQKSEGRSHPNKKLRSVLRQHAALLQKEGKPDGAQKLLAEAAQ